jgi:hypothetical protein
MALKRTCQSGAAGKFKDINTEATEKGESTEWNFFAQFGLRLVSLRSMRLGEY